MDHETSHGPVVGYPVLIKVWLGLLLLTLILVGVSLHWGGGAAVMAMLLVTPTKASLVAYYFMDLRNESNLLKGTVLVTLSVLIIFISLFFSDFWNR